MKNRRFDDEFDSFSDAMEEHHSLQDLDEDELYVLESQGLFSDESTEDDLNLSSDQEGYSLNDDDDEF